MDDDVYGYGTFYEDTTEESGFKYKNQGSEESIDMPFVPPTERTLKKREEAQTTNCTKWTEKKRKRVTECIAAWFHEAGIPSNTICLDSFDSMLQAAVKSGPGVQRPSPNELDGLILQRQVLAINQSIEALKKSWALDGCSILVDFWKDLNQRCLLNFAVHCSQGVSFLHYISLPSYDDKYVFRLVDFCIEEVGEKNVVQVVTNMDSETTVAKMLTAKRPYIFWTHCAAYCVVLMLEDIVRIPLIKSTIAKARSLTAFIYGRPHLLDMMHHFINQQDLLQVGTNDYITSYLNLKRLYDKRVELKTMFVSKEWEESKWSKEAVGKRFYNLVVSKEFWDRVLYAINSFEPLMDVLRSMESSMTNGIPYMTYIYGALESAKTEIALCFENKEEHYLPIWDIINFRQDADLKTPLHLASYFLNPHFYYHYRSELENSEILAAFIDAAVECMCIMCQDECTQKKIVYQLELYTTASMSFRRGSHAIRTQMNLDPVSWWELHGGAAKELTTMALRILRLTCASLTGEQSWIEKIHEKNPSPVKHKQFDDSVFVMVNRRLQAKVRMWDNDPLLAYLPGEDEPFEWLVGMSRLEAQLEDKRSALLQARASSRDEVARS
ncbi:unnamed protein product [Urochloa decumbens]